MHEKIHCRNRDADTSKLRTGGALPSIII